MHSIFVTLAETKMDWAGKFTTERLFHILDQA